MALAFLILGAVLLIAAIRNTQAQLFALLKGDFTGTNNFIFWFVAILAIGILGYVDQLKPLSIALLTLVVIVLFLSKGNPQTASGGFFQNFTTALQSTTTANVTPQQTSMVQ